MHTFPFACFSCRKSFKIAWSGWTPRDDDARLLGHRCPQCRGELRYCGRYFKAPPLKNEREWAELEIAVRNGRRFN